MWNLKKGYKWTYLHNRNRLTDVEDKFMAIKGGRLGGRWTGGLGLADAHCGIWNDWPMNFCITQGTLPIFCDNQCGKRIWKRMNVCTCVIESLLYSRNYHNIVNQLYFNKTWKKWKKEYLSIKKGWLLGVCLRQWHKWSCLHREENTGRESRSWEGKTKTVCFVLEMLSLKCLWGMWMGMSSRT